MSAFTGQIVITPLKMTGGSRWYQLKAPFGFWSHHLQEQITVPAGFVTDMASVPLILQPFLQKDEGLLEAAVFHDFLYSNGCELPVSRSDADRVFLEAMTEAGMGAIKRGWAYWAVRGGAAKSWKRRE